MIFFAIGFGMCLTILDQSAVNIALPQIAYQFQAKITEVQWVAIGYGLTAGAFMLPMGSLSDLLGRRKLYVTGFFISAAGALVSGIAPNLLIAIIFRSLQGVGGAMVQSNALAIMITTFSVEKRGLVIGTFMTIVGVSSVVGPIVGGLIVDQFSWRILLIYPSPLLLIAALLSLYVLPDIKPSKENPNNKLNNFDWKGSIILCLALLVTMLTITNGPRLGWFSPVITISILISLVLTVAFIFQQRNSESPLIPTDFYKHKIFTFGCTASFLAFFTGTSVFFIMPFFLQGVLDYSPAKSGLIITPMAGFFALAGPLAGYFSDKLGWRKIEMLGLITLVVALIGLSFANPQTVLVSLVPFLGCIGLGMGLFYSPNSASVLSVIPAERYGIATAFLNLIRNSSNIIGVSVTTAIVTGIMGNMGYAPSLDVVEELTDISGVKNAFSSGLRISFLAQLLLIASALYLTFRKV